MLTLTIIAVLSFILGAAIGKSLADRGITSDNALKKYESAVVWILVAIALFILALVLVDKLHLTAWLPRLFPSLILLYFGAYIDEAIFALGCFSIGLLLCLELANKSTQLRQLLVALATITAALSILLFYLVPIIGLVESPKIVNGVVLQTTPFTCAPASIATLARWTNKHPNIQEIDVVKLTKTQRWGTSTLAEINALKQLGFNPTYHHNLTIDNLIDAHQLGILHVRESDRDGETFSHAVALLGIDLERELVIIGNPLYGIQSKTFVQMQKYWLGEAILIE